ncbi:hypothetical protein C6501_15765 [Candidatus Poribacteria bacterium]|nr:MAG: hypothetical protein C6501_15765 [Candidatus Poribacteria bacterium]
MKYLKLSTIVIAICTLLLGVQQSDAIKITEFPSDTEDTSYGGYTYHMAYVRTDKPIYYVGWSIDGTHVHGETLDSTTNYASYYPYDKIPGTLQGSKYTIGVKVWEWDADAEEFRSTTASYKVKMFQPKWETEVHGGGGQQHPDVSGYVELTRHYFDGTNIIMEGYVSANNGSDDAVWCSAWFKHMWDKAPANPLEDDAPTENVASGGSYGPHSANTMSLNFFVGGLIREGLSYKLNAHIHMITGLDHRHVDSWNTFDSSDNPEP